MHADGNMRVKLDRRADQMRKDNVICKFARTAAGLHDDRAVGCIRGLHDREHLFHIVDVERRQPIVVLGGMVEKLAKRDKCRDVDSLSARGRAIGLWFVGGCGFRVVAFNEVHFAF